MLRIWKPSLLASKAVARSLSPALSPSLSLALSLALGGLLPCTAPSPAGARSTLEVAWIEFEDALRLARLHQKPVLVYLYTDWCAWCKLMERRTFGHPPSQRYINKHFFATRLNAHTRKEIRYGGRRFRRSPTSSLHSLAALLLNGRATFPTLLVLSPEAQVLGELKGYLTPEELTPRLRFYAEGHSQTKTWREFLQDERLREQQARQEAIRPDTLNQASPAAPDRNGRPAAPEADSTTGSPQNGPRSRRPH